MRRTLKEILKRRVPALLLVFLLVVGNAATYLPTFAEENTGVQTNVPEETEEGPEILPGEVGKPELPIRDEEADPSADRAELVEADDFPEDPDTEPFTAPEGWDTAPSYTHTGNYAKDLLTAAEALLDDAESAEYVREVGGKAYGATRYGLWYGSLYGDWDGMFVSYCLENAGVPQSEMPRTARPAVWAELLKNSGLFENQYMERSTDEVDGLVGASLQGYTLPVFTGEAEVYRTYNQPKSGDLVFFDYDKDGAADHVGIVRGIRYDGGNHPAWLITLEGNTDDKVLERAYNYTYEGILGYGKLPVNRPAQTIQASVNGVTFTA